MVDHHGGCSVVVPAINILRAIAPTATRRQFLFWNGSLGAHHYSFRGFRRVWLPDRRHQVAALVDRTVASTTGKIPNIRESTGQENTKVNFELEATLLLVESLRLSQSVFAILPILFPNLIPEIFLGQRF